ncbi:MAG: hypothetical protein ACRDC6_15785 [Shewanella sp.]
MIQQHQVLVEKIPHYVYVFLVYMFVVGYIYFSSFFSVLRFNAVGYVGIVDLIKMATSSLFNVSLFPYSISMVSLILLMKRDDGRLFEVKSLFLSIQYETAKKVSHLIYIFKREFFGTYIVVCSFLLFGFVMRTVVIENYNTYRLVSFIWTFLGYASAVLLCYVFNLYVSARTASGPFFFRTIIALYFIECGFISVVAGHEDATKIISGKEFTYKVESNKNINDSDRFVWFFGDVYLFWNPAKQSIIASKTETLAEFKHK